MPIVRGNYIPPGIFRNGDASTIYAAVLRKIEIDDYLRERIETSDGDFLDLDWLVDKNKNSDNLVILLHGLAGKTDRPYIKGMAKAFSKKDWDVVAMNFRGCSEELNRRYKSYHAGASDDLAEVMTHVLSLNKYSSIALVGFSLGGNMLMKYLGEDRSRPQQIIGAVGISVPCDLAGSLGAINRMRNFVYSKRFELNLKQHLYDRAQKFPERISKQEISACKSLRDIDDLYTSRAHGYKDATEYYREASAKNFLENITTPTLMINARNDSFLSEKCYPAKVAKDSDYLHLEIPAYGGHVGFVTNMEAYYHEQRAVDFIDALL